MTLKQISVYFCVLSGLLIAAGWGVDLFYGFNAEVGGYLFAAGIVLLLTAFSGFVIDLRRKFNNQESVRSKHSA